MKGLQEEDLMDLNDKATIAAPQGRPKASQMHDSSDQGINAEEDAPHDHDQADSDDQGAQSGDEQAPKTNQKRRRVTRACDECRRKKIKCDGKQPCQHCSDYGYACTYNQPSTRRRNISPSATLDLFSQLERLTKALQSAGYDPKDPLLEQALTRGRSCPLDQGHGHWQQAQSSNSVAFQSPIHASNSGDSFSKGNPSFSRQDSAEGLIEPELDAQLESMVQATGQLSIDDRGNWYYHGQSSGLNFLEMIHSHFGHRMAAKTPMAAQEPAWKATSIPPASLGPDSPAARLKDGTVPWADLPPRGLAWHLCENAINFPSALFRVLHQPSFEASFESVYSKKPEHRSVEDRRFLPLLYAILAVGTLFTKDDDLDSRQMNYEEAIEEGNKYLRASLRLVEIPECRDLTSLQAITYIIMFLQCSSDLEICYSYIGVGMRSAVRMGLHRSLDKTFDPIESEVRKRVFWVLYKMDGYVGALLGLPRSLRSEDIDQANPTEVDDEYITKDGIKPVPATAGISVMAAFNAHTSLIEILSKIVQDIYPVNKNGRPSKTYTVSHGKIREIETELNGWMDRLPMDLRPGGTAPPLLMRVRLLLRISYAYTQIMLYRPWLHYIAMQPDATRLGSNHASSYACAAACVNVSFNTLQILMEMREKKMLVGAYWFSMYTSFFAILSLAYFWIETGNQRDADRAYEEASKGRQLLAQLAKRSKAADVCSKILTSLFDMLPPKKNRGVRGAKGTDKKRRQVSSRPILPSERSPTAASPSSNDGEMAKPRHARRAGESHASKTKSKRASLPNPGRLADQSSRRLSHPSQPADAQPDGIRSAMQSSMDAALNGMSMSGISTSSTSLDTLSQPQSSFPVTPTHDDTFASTFGPDSDSFAGLHPSLAGPMDTLPLNDFHQLIFPSKDPWAYPNQPMTTFENSDFGRGGAGRMFMPQVDGTTATLTPGSFSPIGSSGQPNLGPADLGYGNMSLADFSSSAQHQQIPPTNMSDGGAGAGGGVVIPSGSWPPPSQQQGNPAFPQAAGEGWVGDLGLYNMQDAWSTQQQQQQQQQFPQDFDAYAEQNQNRGRQ